MLAQSTLYPNAATRESGVKVASFTRNDGPRGCLVVGWIGDERGRQAWFPRSVSSRTDLFRLLKPEHLSAFHRHAVRFFVRFRVRIACGLPESGQGRRRCPPASGGHHHRRFKSRLIGRLTGRFAAYRLRTSALRTRLPAKSAEVDHGSCGINQPLPGAASQLPVSAAHRPSFESPGAGRSAAVELAAAVEIRGAEAAGGAQPLGFGPASAAGDDERLRLDQSAGEPWICAPKGGAVFLADGALSDHGRPLSLVEPVQTVQI